jgi:hypothetical protein
MRWQGGIYEAVIGLICGSMMSEVVFTKVARSWKSRADAVAES